MPAKDVRPTYSRSGQHMLLHRWEDNPDSWLDQDDSLQGPMGRSRGRRDTRNKTRSLRDGLRGVAPLPLFSDVPGDTMHQYLEVIPFTLFRYRSLTAKEPPVETCHGHIQRPYGTLLAPFSGALTQGEIMHYVEGLLARDELFLFDLPLDASLSPVYHALSLNEETGQFEGHYTRDSAPHLGRVFLNLETPRLYRVPPFSVPRSENSHLQRFRKRAVGESHHPVSLEDLAA